MREREAAAVELGEQGLHIAQNRFARRRIANVADGGVSRQPVDRALRGEMIADKPEPALGAEAPPIESDDARRLLSTMLEGMEAERRDRRRVGMAVNAEDAAFLAQSIGVKIDVIPGIGCGEGA